jgi:D-alanyl-D-alanine carboxypeptidase
MTPSALLDSKLETGTPGLQYAAVNASEMMFEYSGGWADIARQRPMHPATTLAAYSLSKTITAAATLSAVQAGLLGLEDSAAKYFPSIPYGPDITLRHLLTHSSGIPNPLPLRWVHAVSEQVRFNEADALQQVLRSYRATRFGPGENYAYSNLGYWLLGPILEQAVGRSFVEIVRDHVFRPLGITPTDLAYTIPDASQHACGYLEKYSLFNLVKRFLIDGELIGGYEGSWLRIESHYVNGPAFGGLIGNCRGIARFLQDQLRPQSALFNEETTRLFYQRQTSSAGAALPMTLGWHIGAAGNAPYFFKEGGGGGFHSMMRIYRDRGIATILWSNATGFDVRRCMDAVDQHFL